MKPASVFYFVCACGFALILLLHLIFGPWEYTLDQWPDHMTAFKIHNEVLFMYALVVVVAAILAIRQRRKYGEEDDQA